MNCSCMNWIWISTGRTQRFLRLQNPLAGTAETWYVGDAAPPGLASRLLLALLAVHDALRITAHGSYQSTGLVHLQHLLGSEHRPYASEAPHGFRAVRKISAFDLATQPVKSASRFDCW
jgi:hypothetical protein